MNERNGYMKKIVALILCLILLLVGCGSNNAQETGQEEESTFSVTESSKATESIVATVETESRVPEVASITETVLVDELGIKITAKSIDYDDWYGPAIKLLIENNTDTGLTVQCRNASVNGYMVDTLISCDVASGKKANDELTIYKSSLEQCGIDTIADIEFTFHIFTTDGWDDFLDTDPITLKTTAADSYNYTFDDAGDLLYRENGITVVSKGVYEDSGEHGILVYICNESGFPITAQIRDLSVNGFMINSIFSPDIANGKHAIDKIKFSDSSLEENEITEIEDVEFSFHIFNSNDWRQTFDSEIVTITKGGAISAQEKEQSAATEETNFSFGNLNFSLLAGQEIISEADDQISAKITPNVSAISVFYSEVIDYLGGIYTAALQHTGFINLENRVSPEYSYYNLPVLSESVEFTITKTTDGIYWVIGTFFDEQYVYTISYATNDIGETELNNFTDFLSRIESQFSELKITGYTH